MKKAIALAGKAPTLRVPCGWIPFGRIGYGIVKDRDLFQKNQFDSIGGLRGAGKQAIRDQAMTVKSTARRLGIRRSRHNSQGSMGGDYRHSSFSTNDLKQQGVNGIYPPKIPHFGG